MQFQLVYDAARPPEKNPRVPEKLSRLHKHLGQLKLRLLGESLHLVEIATDLITYLDISVTRFRACRLDAQRQQRVALLHKLKSLAYRLLKHPLACDQMVARSHHDARLRIVGRDVIGRPRNAGSRVAACRLKQYLIF